MQVNIPYEIKYILWYRNNMAKLIHLEVSPTMNGIALQL